ncbi:hypothetical protein NFC73_07485 [Pseudarthrobacter sp. RMG13]|uniref:Chemotaxis protein n=1 Tax=Pseudarthrobacter humi TaxID=2952523 RepID=A0ABT1LM97_9MICC|nr:hypothetical protein [Pseudarthrobacter humi]MCP8999574.1 hypothetical protein [Pseudarthrobacter humi]
MDPVLISQGAVMDGPGWWDWLGLGGTAIGFFVAFVQLSRTRKAAAAATAALGAAQVKLSGDALSAAMPVLRDLQADLDIAISANGSEAAQRALVRFGHAAHEIGSLLGNVEEGAAELVDRVIAAGDRALDVKQSLAGKQNPDVARTAKAISAEIGKLSSELGGVVAQIRYKLQEDPSVRR